MPNNKPSFFLKNEASVSLKDGTLGDYLGGGIKYSSSSGTYEGMLAFKANETSKGGFGEFKYTTPKLHDFALESRTRAQFETSGNTMTTRLAGKYSKNIGKFNIYEIAGATAKLSLEGGAQSVTPVSLTGVGYNITPRLSCYAEGELSKSYNLKKHSWGDFSPSAYLGVKYAF